MSSLKRTATQAFLFVTYCALWKFVSHTGTLLLIAVDVSVMLSRIADNTERREVSSPVPEHPDLENP